MNTLAKKIRTAVALSTLAAVATAFAVAVSAEDAEAGISINLQQACVDQGGVLSPSASPYSVPVAAGQFCDFAARAATCPAGTRFDMVLKNCVADKPEAVAGTDSACWRSNIPLTKPHAPKLCATGSENVGGLCYAACPAGFTGIGAVCWSGATSQPRTQTGAATCGARETNVAGICYENVGRSSTPCPAGYVLSGATCFAGCPADFPVQCGGACARSGAACESALRDQITAPVAVVGSVLATIMFAGGTPALVQSIEKTVQAYNLNVCPSP